MYTPRRKVFWFAIVSRVTILILQFIFNVLCPDHDADAFRSPITDSETSVFDDLITIIFSGLTRWDGEYFIHIAKYGYTYENTLAFYPLYPLLTRIISIPITRVFFILNTHNAIVIAGILINFVCFIKSAIIFYDLSKLVFKKKDIAYKAAILYCINPSSMFFSATYSECLFACLTYYTMLKSMMLDSYVFFPLGLSILVRSNGMLNIGFPIYFQLKNLYAIYLKRYKNLSLKTLCQFTLQFSTLKNLCYICNVIIMSIIPYLLLQVYNYVTFCASSSNQTLLPSHIVNYSVTNELKLPGNKNIQWCKAKIPIAYSYIQQEYWNVGFLNYYQLKQIPNFILAFPVFYIMTSCVKEYFLEHTKYLCTLGFIEDVKAKTFAKTKVYPAEMLVFIIHGSFLTIFCIFFVHIQVSTRLLISASPLVCWYAALKLSYIPDYKSDVIYDDKKNLCSKYRIFFLSQKRYSFEDKLILSYFLGYTILGCFMFSNFLPWT